MERYMRRRLVNWVFVAAVALTACGGSGPGSTVEDFLRAVQVGDFERAAELSYTADAASTAEIAGFLAMLAPDLSSVAAFEILSVDIRGGEGEVEVRFIESDGDSDTDDIHILTVDGSYKVNLDRTLW